MADPAHLLETLDPAVAAAVAAAAESGAYGGDTVPGLSPAITLRPRRHRAISDGAGAGGFDPDVSNVYLSLRAPFVGAALDPDSASMLHISGLNVEADNETDSDHLKLTTGLPNPAIPEAAVEVYEHPVQGTRFAQHIGESDADYRVRMDNWFLTAGNGLRSGWSTDHDGFQGEAVAVENPYRRTPGRLPVVFGEMFDPADLDDQVESDDMDDAFIAYTEDDFSFYTYEHDMLVEAPEEDDSPDWGAPPAARWVIDNLPSVVMTVGDVAEDKKSCAVCKEEFGIDQIAKKLPCSHYYHEECILPWLEIRNNCPLCRFELMTDDADYEDLMDELAGTGASSGET